METVIVACGHVMVVFCSDYTNNHQNHGQWFPITLTYDWRRSSTAAETPIKFQNDVSISTSNLVASRSYDKTSAFLFLDSDPYHIDR